MIPNDIIKDSLRDLLVVPSGGTPTANQYADGLRALNNLVYTWSVHPDMVFEDTREELSIPALTQSITIGPSGTLVTARPIEIIAANLKDSANYEHGLKVIDDLAFNRIEFKDTITLPNRIHLRKTVPNSVLYFNGKTDKAYTLVLTSNKGLTAFADGTTDVVYPEHYEAAFRANLTIAIAPMFGAAKRITQLQKDLAEETKSAVLGDGFQLNASETDMGGNSGYNINGDSWN